MNFSIVIPNYNGAQFLNNFLISLAEAINKCPDSKFEIILIDNNSSDNSLEIFKDFSFLLKESKVKKLSNNYGFAKAVNVGINLCKYDWVVILNNDLELDKNWFSNINSTEINSDVATICGTVLNKDGTHIESQGLKYFNYGKALNINNGTKFSPKLIKSKPYYVWGSSAAAIVYNKKIIQKIGLFDELFFAYEEDVDLSFRLNKAGYKTLLIPYNLSYHLGGGTSNKLGNFRSYHDTRNWHYLILKNYTFIEILSNFPNIFIERLKNLKYLIKNTSPIKIPQTIVRLYFEIIKNTPRILAERKRLQKLLK